MRLAFFFSQQHASFKNHALSLHAEAFAITTKAGLSGKKMFCS